MNIPFVKMHGLGNNYIYVDLFRFDLKEENLADISRKVSNVNTGIGADGLILIQPSTKADVGMRIFNQDGSEGSTCGNGLRCTAKYAFEQGIVDKRHFQIETKANIVEAKVDEQDGAVHEVTINMGVPKFNRSVIPMTGSDDNEVIAEDFFVNDTALKLTAVSMGNPHAVFFVDNVEKVPLYELGPVIEKDSRFPERVNVEFIEIADDNEIHFRVWERGSGVTQACGTGACAAVVAATRNHFLKRNEEVVVHLAGGDLIIRWDEQGMVWMRGEAELIASGVYQYETF